MSGGGFLVPDALVEDVIRAEVGPGSAVLLRAEDLDPCGVCLKGQCDNCDGCLWAASGFTSADAFIRRLGGTR